jgi:predicted ATP-dependent protease
MNESGLSEEKFWQRVRRELERKVSIKRLPSSAVSSYLREASRNRSNEVSLVLKY